MMGNKFTSFYGFSSGGSFWTPKIAGVWRKVRPHKG